MAPYDRKALLGSFLRRAGTVLRSTALSARHSRATSCDLARSNAHPRGSPPGNLLQGTEGARLPGARRAECHGRAEREGVELPQALHRQAIELGERSVDSNTEKKS